MTTWQERLERVVRLRDIFASRGAPVEEIDALIAQIRSLAGRLGTARAFDGLGMEAVGTVAPVEGVWCMTCMAPSIVGVEAVLLLGDVVSSVTNLRWCHDCGSRDLLEVG